MTEANPKEARERAKATIAHAKRNGYAYAEKIGARAEILRRFADQQADAGYQATADSDADSEEQLAADLRALLADLERLEGEVERWLVAGRPHNIVAPEELDGAIITLKGARTGAEARLSALEGACEPFLEALEEAEDRYPEAGSAYMVEEARSHLSADHFRILRQALASTVPVEEEPSWRKSLASDKDWLADHGRKMGSGVGQQAIERLVVALDHVRGDAEAQPSDAWRSIQTAPRDGTHVILAFGQDHACEGWWNDDDAEPRPWCFIDRGDFNKDVINRSRDGEYGPSHWQPMPYREPRNRAMPPAQPLPSPEPPSPGRTVSGEEREARRAALRAAIYAVAKKAIYQTAHRGPEHLCSLIADGAMAAFNDDGVRS